MPRGRDASGLVRTTTDLRVFFWLLFNCVLSRVVGYRVYTLTRPLATRADIADVQVLAKMANETCFNPRIAMSDGVRDARTHAMSWHTRLRTLRRGTTGRGDPSTDTTSSKVRASEGPANSAPPTVMGTPGAFGAPLCKGGGAAPRARTTVAVARLNLGAGGGTEDVGRIAGAGACTTQLPNFASSPVLAAGSSSHGAPLCGTEPNRSCCAARVLSNRLRSPDDIVYHGWRNEEEPIGMAHSPCAGQAVRGPRTASIRPMSGLLAVAAALPSGARCRRTGVGKEQPNRHSTRPPASRGSFQGLPVSAPCRRTCPGYMSCRVSSESGRRARRVAFQHRKIQRLAW